MKNKYEKVHEYNQSINANIIGLPHNSFSSAFFMLFNSRPLYKNISKFSVLLIQFRRIIFEWNTDQNKC